MIPSLAESIPPYQFLGFLNSYRDPKLHPPPAFGLKIIRGRYWSVTLDDIFLWPPIVTEQEQIVVAVYPQLYKLTEPGPWRRMRGGGRAYDVYIT
jgi:hypothetical protein